MNKVHLEMMMRELSELEIAETAGGFWREAAKWAGRVIRDGLAFEGAKAAAGTMGTESGSGYDFNADVNERLVANGLPPSGTNGVY